MLPAIPVQESSYQLWQLLPVAPMVCTEGNSVWKNRMHVVLWMMALYSKDAYLRNNLTEPRLKRPQIAKTIFIYLFFWIFEFYFFIQQVLISYPFYTHQCIYVNPNLPIHHTTTTPTTTFPLWCPYVCSLHLCHNLCPANRFICTIFLSSTYMREYTIFVFLFLTYFTLYDSL